jgi:hypothetical protein
MKNLFLFLILFLTSFSGFTQINLDSLCFIQVITKTKIRKDKTPKYNREFIFHESSDWVMEFKSIGVNTYVMTKKEIRNGSLYVECKKNGLIKRKVSFIVPFSDCDTFYFYKNNKKIISNDFKYHLENVTVFN